MTAQAALCSFSLTYYFRANFLFKEGRGEKGGSLGLQQDKQVFALQICTLAAFAGVFIGVFLRVKSLQKNS